MPNLTHQESDAIEIVDVDGNGPTVLLLVEHSSGDSSRDDEGLRNLVEECRALLERATLGDRRDVGVFILGAPVIGASASRLRDPRRAELLLSLISHVENAEFDERTWVRFTPEALASRMLHSVPSIMSAGNSMWDEAIGPFFDTAGLRRWKGVTRQRLDALRKSNRLLALTSADNKLLYPEFQFGPAGELLPHLEEVLPALRRSYNDWDAALWLNTPSDDRDGKTAAQVLRDGDVETYQQILAEARADAARLAS